jgi:hypothetical protein
LPLSSFLRRLEALSAPDYLLISLPPPTCGTFPHEAICTYRFPLITFPPPICGIYGTWLPLLSFVHEMPTKLRVHTRFLWPLHTIRYDTTIRFPFVSTATTMPSPPSRLPRDQWPRNNCCRRVWISRRLGVRAIPPTFEYAIILDMMLHHYMV